MKICDLTDAAYASDGGSVMVLFVDDVGRQRVLHAVQDRIPIDEARAGSPHWRRGAILLDGEPVTDPDQLLRLHRELLDCAARLPAESNRIPLPKNTIVAGDDLRDYLTLDPEGKRRWLVSEAARRIGEKIADASD